MSQSLPIARIRLLKVRAADAPPSSVHRGRNISGFPEREDEASRFFSLPPVIRLRDSDVVSG